MRTEIIVFGAKTEWLKVTQNLHSLSLEISIKARNLGVIIDSDLHFDSHIKSVMKSAYYHNIMCVCYTGHTFNNFDSVPV